LVLRLPRFLSRPSIPARWVRSSRGWIH